MESYIGRLLDNRYEILEVIGTGGMAVVYRALDHRLNRPVAVKILKDDLSRNQEFRRRFHAESQAVAMVSHPNIVGVYDVSRTGEADYIVMELIEGISLKQYLERKGNLNWRETLHFSIQIAKALEHAHAKGIVHRDIKPHNIMILKDGSVKVADFGIARVGSSKNTLTREALGSVHYISPEQAKGAHVDNRSDLYSLGVVMYEMLTGRPPYDGETPVAVAIQHINGGAHCPSELVTGIPLGLEQITLHAMNYNLNMRYANATEMLRDMEEFRKNPAITFTFGSPAPVVIPVIPVKQDNRSTEEALAAERARREAEEEEEKHRKILTVAIAAAAVLFVILVVVLVLTITSGSSDNEGTTQSTAEQEYVLVDDFVGMRLEDIDPRDYPNLNVDVEDVDEAYSEKYEAGYIIRQTPEAHSEVRPGRTVSFTVSLGKNENIMPDFVNKSEEEAFDYLKDLKLGLNIMIQEESSEEISKGYIIRTEPSVGEELSKSQNVTLYVSLGSNKMPDLRGEAADDAQTRLDKMEINLKIQIEEEASESVPKGYVIRTEPAADARLAKGQGVVLYVSAGSDRMMDVIGESLENAITRLKAMELDLKFVTDLEEDSESVPEGKVCRTEPAAGDKLVKGQQVMIYISTGSRYAIVPNVLGKTPEEAKRILEEAKLVCTISQDSYYYEGVEEGHVGAMSVLPETRVDKGSAIILYLCAEPEETEPTTESTSATPSESSSSEVPAT